MNEKEERKARNNFNKNVKTLLNIITDKDTVENIDVKQLSWRCNKYCDENPNKFKDILLKTDDIVPYDFDECCVKRETVKNKPTYIKLTLKEYDKEWFSLIDVTCEYAVDMHKKFKTETRPLENDSNAHLMYCSICHHKKCISKEYVKAICES